MIITVKPVDRYGTFAAYLGDRLLTTSKQPFLDGARVLLAEGIDPATWLSMRHFWSETISLRGTVRAAAKLTVKETATIGPVFRKWEPDPRFKPVADVSAIDPPIDLNEGALP